ncbi:MAG: signal peptide peptidase SppA [Gemmatales bacterium]|nr:signal peptide peptidase SppA [Gemmatales bacterium]
MSNGSDVPVVQPLGSGQTIIIRETTRPSAWTRVMMWLLVLFLFLSVLVNCVLMGALSSLTTSVVDRLQMKYHSGKESSNQAVALVRLEGVLVEGLLEFVYKQLRDAAQDEQVKAVVLEVNSPGGTVTGSDLVHHYVRQLREGQWEKQTSAKPVVVHMGSIAASGGYYVAAAADHIVAQPHCLTGSIGVYAAFLDLHKLAEKYGIEMKIVKRGELKGPTILHEMTPEERLQWELLVGEAYERFQQVVEQGRGPKLKHKLREPFELTTDTGEKVMRRIADGGVFTAEQAKEIGLVDEVGYLEQAIKKAAELANLTEYKVVQYKRPFGWLGDFFDARAQMPRNLESAWPGWTLRLWYLTPGYELAPVPLDTWLLRRP